MPETVDTQLEGLDVGPEVLDELMLLTQVMIATRAEKRPLRQHQIDDILGVRPPPQDLAG